MAAEIDRDSAIPLYQQLGDIFTTKIDNGEWAASQRIPSENELNRAYGVSRMTIRGVLNKLVDEGRIVRVPGKGTFVTPQKIRTVSPAYRGIREQLEAMGYHIGTRIVSTNRLPAPPQVRERLNLHAGDEVHAIVRLRMVDGRPFSVHRSFVPAALAPDLDRLDVVGEQLCVVLEQHFGLDMHAVSEELEAVAVNRTDASLLELRSGEPVLQLTDVISSAAGVPFEYSTIIFRGDRMRLQFDYKQP